LENHMSGHREKKKRNEYSSGISNSPGEGGGKKLSFGAEDVTSENRARTICPLLVFGQRETTNSEAEDTACKKKH